VVSKCDPLTQLLPADLLAAAARGGARRGGAAWLRQGKQVVRRKVLHAASLACYTVARCRVSQPTTYDATHSFVKAKEEAERLQARAEALVARRGGALQRAEKLQAERYRRDAAALRAIGDAMRATFRALCARGDASLEYAASGPTLFEAGVSVHAKPPAAEWVRFEQLSGGQQALVAVALQLACQVCPR